MSNCLRYWDLSNNIRITDAIALWCGVEPAELARLDIETQCMSAKRAALETALREGRLEYESLGVVSRMGKIYKDVDIEELIEKDRLVINKASLRRWFEQLPITDRPTFLFDEERETMLPDGSNVAEMNSMKALAIMAHILAKQSPKFKIGERPNAQNIGQEVVAFADDVLVGDTHTLKSFHKKLSHALKLFDEDHLPGSYRKK